MLHVFAYGAAAAAAVAAGMIFVPVDGHAAIALVAAAVPSHMAMLAMDARSTAQFGMDAVLRAERSWAYRALSRMVGLGGGAACMGAIEYALAGLILPYMLAGAWPDLRVTGMCLLVFAAIHAIGWRSNRSLAGAAAGAAKLENGAA